MMKLRHTMNNEVQTPNWRPQVADDLMAKDALKHYVQIKHGIVVGEYLSPSHALVSSFIASVSGGFGHY